MFVHTLSQQFTVYGFLCSRTM